MANLIGTSTLATATPPGSNTLVTIAVDGTALVLWGDGTNIKFSSASSPYTTWTTTTLTSGTRFSASAFLDTSDNVAVICPLAGGVLNYFPLTKSGATYTLGTAVQVAATGNIGGGSGVQFDKDSQGRYWAVCNNSSSTGVQVFQTTTPATLNWTPSLTLTGLATDFRSPFSDIIGNYLVVCYPNATSVFSYQRLDVSSGSLGAWSTVAAIANLGGAPLATAARFSLRSNGAGVAALVYTTSTGIFANIYTAATDTWSANTQLSTTGSDLEPVVVSVGSDLYAIWSHWAAPSNFSLVFKKWTASSGTWDTAITTLIASGTNIHFPGAGYGNNTLGISHTVGTASPWNVNFEVVPFQNTDMASRVLQMSAAQLKDMASRFAQRSSNQLKETATRFLHRSGATQSIRDAVTRLRVRSANQLRDTATRFAQALGTNQKDTASRLRMRSSVQLRDVAARLMQSTINQLKEVTARFVQTSACQLKDGQLRFVQALATGRRDTATRLRQRSLAHLTDTAMRLRHMSAARPGDVSMRFRLLFTVAVAATMAGTGACAATLTAHIAMAQATMAGHGTLTMAGPTLGEGFTATVSGVSSMTPTLTAGVMLGTPGLLSGAGALTAAPPGLSTVLADTLGGQGQLTGGATATVSLPATTHTGASGFVAQALGTSTALAAQLGGQSGGSVTMGAATALAAQLGGQAWFVAAISGTGSCAATMAGAGGITGSLASTTPLVTAMAGTSGGAWSVGATTALAGTLAAEGQLSATMGSPSATLTSTMAGHATMSGTPTLALALPAVSIAGSAVLRMQGGAAMATALSIQMIGTSVLSMAGPTLGVDVQVVLAAAGTVAAGAPLEAATALFLVCAGTGLLLANTQDFIPPQHYRDAVTWVTRDLKTTWVTRDEHNIWTTRG